MGHYYFKQFFLVMERVTLLKYFLFFYTLCVYDDGFVGLDGWIVGWTDG